MGGILIFADFNPTVKVRREKRRYGGHIKIEGDEDFFSYEKKTSIIIETEGTVVVEIEMPGWKFVDAAAKTRFDKEIEKFLVNHAHGLDNFNDEDREEIKEYVECLLRECYNDRKVVPVK